MNRPSGTKVDTVLMAMISIKFSSCLQSWTSLAQAMAELYLILAVAPALFHELWRVQVGACMASMRHPQQLRFAEERAGDLETYQCADVTADPQLPTDVQHAVAVLSLQDIESLDDAVAFLAKHVPVGGKVLVVLTHPCFRVPKHATWGWDEERQLQYRRVDSYMSIRMLPIRTNPGQGGESVMSKSFHRPLATYVNAFGSAGFGIVGSQELCSHRRGTQGSRASAEDRACREIPVFMVLRAVRLP